MSANHNYQEKSKVEKAVWIETDPTKSRKAKIWFWVADVILHLCWKWNQELAETAHKRPGGEWIPIVSDVHSYTSSAGLWDENFTDVPITLGV